MLRTLTRLGCAASCAATLALAGCGGSHGTGSASPVNPFNATVSTYYAGLAGHDATAACAQITPAFWNATVSDANAKLSAAGAPPLPRGSCVQVLRYILSRVPTGPSQLKQLHVTVHDVTIHGATAFAIVTNGSSAQNSRFVRSASGRWLIDCCTATQAKGLSRTVYRVPSTSMEPTIKPGEIVTADNTALRIRAPSLGEIVTLHPPAGAACLDPRQGDGSQQPCGAPAQSASAQIAIKRVAGVPGDRIAIVGGHVVRNGLVAHEPYILACGGALCDFPKPTVVPPGMYYLLGDNRGNSLDSRFYGPVRRAWVLGLVQR